MEVMGGDRRKAYQALRAVLQRPLSLSEKNKVKP